MSFYQDIAFRNMRKCTGLYLWFGAEKELYVTLTITTLKKDRVTIDSACTGNSLGEMVRKIPPNSPLIISVDGINVIHRIVSQTSSDNPILQAFPGARAKDFMIQRHVTKEDKMIISLIRRDEFNELIKTINEMGLLIYDIRLGPFSIDNLPDITNDTGELRIPFYVLYIKNNGVTGFEKSLYKSIEDNYFIDFDGDKISSEYLVPLSVCCGYYQTTGKEEIDLIFNDQRRELAAKKILSVTVLPFVLVVFMALMLNFYLFSRYERESRLLDQALLSGRQQIVHIDSLRKAVASKQKVLETKQNEDARLFAFFSDKIASCVPEGILFQEMNIYPQVSAAQNRNTFLFQDSTIIINGFTDNSVTLELFVKSLSAYSWIESVKILSFSEAKDGIRSFRLELAISDRI